MVPPAVFQAKPTFSPTFFHSVQIPSRPFSIPSSPPSTRPKSVPPRGWSAFPVARPPGDDGAYHLPVVVPLGGRARLARLDLSMRSSAELPPIVRVSPRSLSPSSCRASSCRPASTQRLDLGGEWGEPAPGHVLSEDVEEFGGHVCVGDGLGRAESVSDHPEVVALDGGVLGDGRAVLDLPEQADEGVSTCFTRSPGGLAERRTLAKSSASASSPSAGASSAGRHRPAHGQRPLGRR